MSKMAIAVNSELRDIIRRKDWFDPDKFSLRASESISRELARGFRVDMAVERGLKATHTRFFQSNRGARLRLPRLLGDAMGMRGLCGNGLLDMLMSFKRFAESQLVSDLAKTKKEDACRSHLQTALHSIGRTYREVPIGAGRSDIIVLLPESEEVIEAKVWKGQQYHDDGLLELAQYVRTEGLTRGYYVVFEFFRVEPLTPNRDSLINSDVEIDVLFVHIPLTAPSKLGRARRKV